MLSQLVSIEESVIWESKMYRNRELLRKATDSIFK